MTKVLIAVDETEESVHAAAVAQRLFGNDAEYIAVSVIDAADIDLNRQPWFGTTWGTRYPVPYGAVWPLPGLIHTRMGIAPSESGDTPTDVARRAATETARDVVEESGVVTAEPVGETGDPVDMILRASEERSADVIVVGTHDRSWFDRLLRSSVREKVLKSSDVPILVTRGG